MRNILGMIVSHKYACSGVALWCGMYVVFGLAEPLIPVVAPLAVGVGAFFDMGGKQPTA